ncbi:hypothetical protein DE146DRAFT_103759 [Phaeosphaeria sp. MPI-PUGE-AT-0046c]|nr:hypothetical protein DE146DRAFT_103759 [Phaeosphaeria sp. MPI-PUGE-AT-0046c]
MCTETHYLFRRCGHTRFLRWEYCSVILPPARIPATGRLCRLYRLKHKDNQEQSNCFECVRERMMAGRAIGEGSEDDENRRRKKERKMGMGRRVFRRFLSLGRWWRGGENTSGLMRGMDGGKML